MHLEYNNAFLVDGNRTEVPALTARAAYESGYVDRPDRRNRFSWSRDVEVALSLLADEAVDFFRRLFGSYEGSYDLAIAADGVRDGGDEEHERAPPAN